MVDLNKFISDELLYVISPKDFSCSDVAVLLKKYPEIKFVSLMGVDLTGNATDEKIPISIFFNDIEEFLNASIQTDGSSVVLPGIATLNNGKVDFVADKESNWFIDYNYENIDGETGKPVGTLKIPSFLMHNDIMVDSRSILQRSVKNFKKVILELIDENPKMLDEYGIVKDDIKDVIMTTATELEFWVKTPNDAADIEALSASQELQESYWKRTKGVVRTSLEQCLVLMEKYGFEPEMGHKEVGGIQARLDGSGGLSHIMEQLEIDWKYSTSLQSADNEKFIKVLIKEIFRMNGLEVTFQAKPIEGVAGNGKHTHVGSALKLKNGKIINLFTAKDIEKNYLSPIGIGAIMGLLKNYEVINPFISFTIDSLNRLKPGFEAPICIVSSLGHNVETPSRNRTVLAGLVRDLASPLATRFEVRSPNPNTNTYIAVAAMYQSMLDGIKAAIKSGKSATELEADFSKAAGTESFYLEKERAYRSEEDVFEHYTAEERDIMFGKPPATVYENICNLLYNYPEKCDVLIEGGVMSDKMISSYATAVINKWVTEILNRIIPEYMEVVRSCKPLHLSQYAHDLDIKYWARVDELRHYLMKDAYKTKSLFSRMREAAAEKDYNRMSELQIKIFDTVTELKEMYNEYKRNLLDF